MMISTKAKLEPRPEPPDLAPADDAVFRASNLASVKTPFATVDGRLVDLSEFDAEGAAAMAAGAAPAPGSPARASRAQLWCFACLASVLQL